MDINDGCVMQKCLWYLYQRAIRDSLATYVWVCVCMIKVGNSGAVTWWSKPQAQVCLSVWIDLFKGLILSWAPKPKAQGLGPLIYGYVVCLCVLNTLRPRQNRCHSADDIFKCMFLNKNGWISIKLSLKFVPKGLINNVPSLLQIIAWCWPGDKPLSEPIMVSLLTHICVTQPQLINCLIRSWDLWGSQYRDKPTTLYCTSYYQHRQSYCGDMLILWLLYYLLNVISYTGKIALYWNGFLKQFSPKKHTIRSNK